MINLLFCPPDNDFTFVFSCIGLLTGLWAEGWDQLNIWSTFIITPLVFLGGVFHSINAVPGILSTITKINPIFYMIDVFRWSMLGISEANIFIDFAVIILFGIVSFASAVYLFKIGWKIRK